MLALLFSLLALAGSWAEESDTPPEPQTSESDGKEKSSGYEAPTLPSSGIGQPAPQSPTEAFETLESEWQAFTEEWDRFYPTLKALGIELGELPSYLESLEKSLKAERGAREAEVDAAARDAAAARLERDEARKERDRIKVVAWIIAAAGGAGWLVYIAGR